jgi:hypothetical protein
MQIGNTWNPLRKVYWTSTLAGVGKIEMPSDCERLFLATALDWNHSGELSGVTSASSVALAADEEAGAVAVEGAYLIITDGTGVNQGVQVQSYDATTKVCTMAEAFSTAPVAGDSYIIAAQLNDMIEAPSLAFVREQFNAMGAPRYWFPYPDYIELFYVPDKVYGVRLEYFADLRRLDTASDLYNAIIRRWAGVLEQGVYVWKLGEDDNRYEREMALFARMMNDIKARDLYMADISYLQRTVQD